MLESYITPLLMGYVNKYIKNLKPSDLSLSVWGGDVVLQNLELNLDVLQQELNLPVTFLSGKIHELCIHVPWTRITYEPVVITINTIEFIVKLRDPDEKTHDEEEEESEENKKEMKNELQKARVQREAEHLSPGYVQGVLNKVINNVSVCVNNLILKYVEDDIVFSLNVKSASLFSVNEEWEKAFIELSLPSLCLRKVCEINDLTVCLDSRNADGKIEMYQDPLLYKCNLSCRVLSKYQGIGSTTAYENHVNLYCESFDMSITDLQLPMLVRLMKLIMGLYYRTLDLPGCNYKQHPAKEMLEERRQRETAQSVVNRSKVDNLDDSGWASWAWSKIPYLAEDENDPGNLSGPRQDPVLVFGIYITQCSLTLKVINEASNNSIVGSRRFEFSPVLSIEMSGCAVEMLAKGEEYFDCQLGVSNIVGYLVGGCLCQKENYKDIADVSMLSFEDDELNKDDEDELFFRMGSPQDTAENGVGFLEGSLFGQKEDGLERLDEPTSLPQKGNQFVEAEITKKFGACFLDYFYTMELPALRPSESESWDQKYVSAKEAEVVKETSEKRIIIGRCQTFVTSKLFHLITKVVEFSADEVPPKKVKEQPYVDPFVLEQLRSGNLPSRSLHITCHSASCNVCFADHAFGRGASMAESTNRYADENNQYGMIFQVDRVDYQANSPMFPVELNALMEKDSKSVAILYRAGFCDYYLKAFGVQVGLCQNLSDCQEPAILNVIAPLHASLYAKSCICHRIDKEIFKTELRVETPSLSFCLTKAQLLLMVNLYESWIKSNPEPTNGSLLNDVFHPKANGDSISSILDVSLIGVQGKYMQNDLLHAAAGSLGSIKVAIQALQKDAAQSTAIVYGPLNTARMSDVEGFLNETDENLRELPNETLLSFKAHLPLDEAASSGAPAIFILELKGLAVNLDPMLLSWIDYMPSSSTKGREKSIQRKASKLLSRTLSASTPKKKSYSRVFGTSQISKERNKVKKLAKVAEGELEKKQTRENRLKYAMNILKSLIIKAEFDTISIIMPRKSLVNEQGNGVNLFNIPHVLRSNFKSRSNTCPECLIVTFPKLKLASSNVKELESSTDIPVITYQNQSAENSLPWSLNGDGFTIYTLTPHLQSMLPEAEKHYIWKPSQWTMFLAAAHASLPVSKDSPSSLSALQDSLSSVGVKPVTNQMNSATSMEEQDSVPSLGFCVHIDLSSVMLSISRPQAAIVLFVSSRLLLMLEILQGGRKADVKGSRVASPPTERGINGRPALREDEVRSTSSASTAEPLDDATLSTEASLSNSLFTSGQNEDFAVSLWLQWIIPKMCVTLYSEESIRSDKTIYKIPIELDDLSFAFDYQKSKIQMSSKVGTVAVKSYVLRQELKEWEADRFQGVLLSCEDFLSRDIELLTLANKQNFRAFFNMTYSRVLLSNVHSRARYTSIRSEGVNAREEQEHDEVIHLHQPSKYIIDERGLHQHNIALSVQSFDVIGNLDPVLHVLKCFSDLSPNDSTQRKNDSSPMKEVDPLLTSCEAIFQPFPTVDIESKGARLLIPTKDVPNATGGENMLVCCFRSLTLSSDPGNRISSTVLNKEGFRCLRRHQRDKYRRTKTWHVQYQIDFHGMSVWTGLIGEVTGKGSQSDSQLSLLVEKQNPALEWNYEIPKQKEPAKLTPVLMNFGCSAVFAPSLNLAVKNGDESLRLTASSLEMNFQKDLHIYVNPYQVNLIVEVAQCISESLQSPASQEELNLINSRPAEVKPVENIDSGVASVLSAKVSELSKDQVKPVLPDINSKNSFQFEILITSKKISGSLYVKNVYEDQKSILKPIFNCQFTQPSVNISSFKEQVFELVLHDFLLSAAKDDAICDGMVPDQTSYENVLVKTERGRPCIKTGLFPSALVVKLTGKKLFELSVEVLRPLNTEFYLKIFDSLESFMNEIQSRSFTNAKQEENITDSYPPLLLNTLTLKTDRLSLKFAMSPQNSTCSLILRLRAVNGSVDVRSSCQGVDAASFKCNVDGMEVNIRQIEEDCRLLSPCIFDVDGKVDSVAKMGSNGASSATPRLNISLTSGLVRLRFGQQHYENLTALMNEFNTLVECESKETADEETTEFSSEDQANVSPCSEIEYSYDDLRTQSFEYVLLEGNDGAHPLPNQITFSEEGDEKPPTMTWRYSRPRFLTDLTILPLPFHLDETALPEDELSRIPCVIRYWDAIECNYVTYQNFYLLQSESYKVSFPDPTVDSAANVAVAAEEWQVVVDVAIESESADVSDAEEIPEDILTRVTSVYKTPVSATSLAGCLKINSCYIPSKVPYLNTSASIGCLEITLLNHFKMDEHGNSTAFSPFFMDPFTYLFEQEACLIKLNDLMFKTSHLGGAYPRQSLSLELDLEVNVISYDNLSWLKCLAVSSVSNEVLVEVDPRAAKHDEKWLEKSKVSFSVESVDAYVSQTIVHTITMTTDHWLNYNKRESCMPVLNHFVICNETEDVIRFGQDGTDEDIILASGQMYPYSWRAPREQALHLCNDSIGDWRWTDSFDIHDNVSCKRSIQHNTHQSVFHIEFHRKAGIQRQVIIKGGIVFRNCLNNDIEFEIILHHTELVGALQQQKISQVVKNFLVPSKTARPSLLISPETITAVYVRFPCSNAPQGWTSALTLSQDEGHEFSIPLQLQDGEDLKNCWYSVSRTEDSVNAQLQVCICPLFIMRSHLCWPVTMTANARDKGNVVTCISTGKGKETQIDQLDSSTWYNVTFQLDGTNDCTDPPLAVNTTFIQLLRKKNRIDSQLYVHENEWPYTDACGIPEEEPPKIIPPSTPHSSSEVGADLQCQLLQKWKHLPTILIEIKPKIIINNSSSADFILRDPHMHLTWQLKSGMSVSSPAIQNTVQIGLDAEDLDTPIWSSEIQILEQPKSRSSTEEDQRCTEELSPFSSINLSIIAAKEKVCYQFAATSKKRNGIIIINITERFCLHNLTNMLIKCCPTLCSTHCEKAEIENFLELPEFQTPLSLSKIYLRRPSESHADDLFIDLSAFELRFYFYATESSPSIFEDRHAFNLSRDHLRENVSLKLGNGDITLLAVTSCFENGVINVFLDKEPCASFIFINNTNTDLLVKSDCDISDSPKEHIPSSNEEPGFEPNDILEIRAGKTVQFQRREFNKRFPRIENRRSGIFQIAVLPDADTFSDTVEIKDDIERHVLHIGTYNIALSCVTEFNSFHVFLSEETEDVPSFHHSMNLPSLDLSIFNTSIVLIDHESHREVLAVNARHSSFRHHVTEPRSGDSESLISVEIGSIQIDNQLTDDGGHFPVCLLPLREVTMRYRGEMSQNAPLADAHASPMFSMLTVKCTVYTLEAGKLFLDLLSINIQPVEVYLEDSLLYQIAYVIDSFSPPRTVGVIDKADASAKRLRKLAGEVLHPINIGRVEVSDIKILLSIHASVKMYLATDHMPVVFGKLNCEPAITTSRELSRKVLYHYATQALVRAGLMLGSLEILANPTGFVRSIGQGIADFFTLPYDGLTRGPSAFVSGITRGMGSFVRHTSVGALTSITNFASSVSRNMDRLSLDEQYLIWQEEHRRRAAFQAFPGIGSALGSFGVSLLGAVAGVAEHPIVNIQNARDTKEAVKGVVTGVGKGLVGMVTKPIGGAMELVSQTGQGLLLGTGLVIPPIKVRSALTEKDMIDMETESFMKYCWKVIRLDFERFTDLFIIKDVYVTSAYEKQGYKGSVILTSSALYLYDNAVNNIRKAFSCNEVSLRLSKDGPHTIYIDQLENMSRTGYGLNVDEDTFISAECGFKDMASSISSICLQIDPRLAVLLLSQFNFQKNIAEERLVDEIGTFGIGVFK